MYEAKHTIKIDIVRIYSDLLMAVSCMYNLPTKPRGRNIPNELTISVKRQQIYKIKCSVDSMFANPCKFLHIYN